MKNIRYFLLLCALPCISLTVSAQDFDKEFEELDKAFANFQKEADSDYEKFRDECNAKYADFLAESWRSFRALAPFERPKERQDLPLSVLEQMKNLNGGEVLPVLKAESTDAGIRFRGLVIDAKKILQARRAKPLVQRRSAEEQAERDILLKSGDEKSSVFSFDFYGTTMNVELDDLRTKLKIDHVAPQKISEVWKLCSNKQYTKLIQDCLDLKDKYKLCDWAYLLMLKALSDEAFGEHSNESTFLTAYIYCQSGYRIRLGQSSDRLLMFYGSEHCIYDVPRYRFDQSGFYFYIFGEDADLMSSIEACDKGIADIEQPLSLLIQEKPLLTETPSNMRIIESDKYEDVRMEVCVNENLIDFFNSYPSSYVNDNHLTRWAMYANTPLSEDVKVQIYPGLRAALENLSEEDQVRRLLSLIQPRSGKDNKPETSLIYGSDSIWGGDRAFFAEETLFYEYSDCEDHAILFSRLVRDLLGLQVMLVYYPPPCTPHLATAVRFSKPLSGKSHIVMPDGDIYYVCDPTNYIPEPGVTMEGMDNSIVQVIILD